MRAVGIKLLKNKLSEYVRLAANGETILVTDRDKVVAELTPPVVRPISSDAFIAKAVREGWITPASVHSPMPRPPAPVMTLAQLMEELNNDRQDR